MRQRYFPQQSRRQSGQKTSDTRTFLGRPHRPYLCFLLSQYDVHCKLFSHELQFQKLLQMRMIYHTKASVDSELTCSLHRVNRYKRCKGTRNPESLNIWHFEICNPGNWILNPLYGIQKPHILKESRIVFWWISWNSIRVDLDHVSCLTYQK